MAGDWIKMRTDLAATPAFVRISQSVGKTESEMLFTLYELASWFSRHGDYGKICADPSIIDCFAKTHGLSDYLIREGWLRVEGGILTLRWFTDVSTQRKSLGRRIRRLILEDTGCVICMSPNDLVIDHRIPVSRGGSSEPCNLQPLCRSCNAKKGTKSMEEFTRDR